MSKEVSSRWRKFQMPTKQLFLVKCYILKNY
uniref:Uncharacterized protein n=1 Tax=Anguilla anguilla TaxID=7936 RepID=A0A0E9RJZ5_ANGAN